MDMTIEPPVSGDVSAVVDLVALAQGCTRPEVNQTLHKLVCDSGGGVSQSEDPFGANLMYARVARVAGQVVGYIYCTFPASYLAPDGDGVAALDLIKQVVEVNVAAVDPGFQRQGIGGALVADALDYYRDQGHMVALVTAPTASSASYWEGVGFTMTTKIIKLPNAAPLLRDEKWSAHGLISLSQRCDIRELGLGLKARF